MKASLIQLRERLEEIRFFIDGIDRHSDILGAKIKDEYPPEVRDLITKYQTHFQQFGTKRVFDYKTIIISLYGALENFIESLIKDYLHHINTIVKDYTKLSKKIIENHFRLSAELLLKLDYPKYQNIVTRDEIIKNLNACISTPNSYKLNVEAFTQHNSNFRHKSINDFYASVDILGISDRVKSHPIFKEFYSKIDQEFDIEQTKNEKVFEILNDLALRRNDVAHGVEGEIASIDILRAYIDFVEIYSTCLFDVVYSEVLPYEVQFNSVPLNPPIQIIDNSIICLTLDNTSINIGDSVIAETSNQVHPFIFGEIQEIQINKASFIKVFPKPGLNVGFKVNFNAKMNQKFFLVKQSV